MRNFESRPRREAGDDAKKRPDDKAAKAADPAAPADDRAAPAGKATPAARGDGPAKEDSAPRHAVPHQAAGRERNLFHKTQAGGDGTAARRFTPKQMRVNILVGSLILVLLLALLLAALLPGCNQMPASSSMSLSRSASSASPSSSEPDYDMSELAIPEGEFADTILAATEDAGQDYVDETLFLGDSNTERLLNFSSVTGLTRNTCIGIESMGIGSVLGLRCVRFSGLADMTMPSAVAVLQPRRVVITFGTNNVGMYTDSFIETYRTAAKAIYDAYPYADIIIGSVFPISQGCRYGNMNQKGVDEFNLALVEMADEEGYKFLNWSEAIKDAKTGYAAAGNMSGDGVHISTTGAEKLMDYFRTHSYITSDLRPKPLKAIPTRLATPEGLFPKPSSSASDSDSDSDSSSSKTSSSSSSSSSKTSSSSSSEAPSSTPSSSSDSPPPPSSSSDSAPSSSSDSSSSSSISDGGGEPGGEDSGLPANPEEGGGAGGSANPGGGSGS